MLLVKVLREPPEVAAIIFIAKLPARHTVGPTQSVASGSPASPQPCRATLNSIPEAGKAWPLTR